MANSQATAVLTEGDVSTIVKTVLDTPVGTDQGEQAIWIGSFRGKAGNTEGGFRAYFTGIELDETSLQFEDLLDRRPIEIVVEKIGHGDRASLQAAVAFVSGRGGVEIGHSRAETRLARFGTEDILDVLPQLRMIVFDQPYVVSLGSHDLS